MSASPGNPGDLVPRDGLRKLSDRVASLEQLVRQLTGNTVDQGNIVVPDGSAIRVTDASSDTVATLGTIDGLTDVHIHDLVSGDTLPTSQLAFGTDADDDGGSSYQQNVLNTWVQGPISLTVTVKTGRLWVCAGAQIATQPGVTQRGFMSWQLAGPTSVAANLNRALVLVSPGSVAIGAGFPALHKGLTPGDYTITDWYQTTGALAAGAGPIFSDRTLIAIPY